MSDGEQGVGDDLGAFGGGMNAVALDGAGNVDQIFVDHGHEGDVVLGREIAKDLVEVTGCSPGRSWAAG